MHQNLKVPFVDLKFRFQPFRDELHNALDAILDHGQFILGPEVDRFEADMAAYLDTAYAIGVANGTDALLLSLRCCSIGAGDEVITTPMSYLASTSAIALSGATPVFADVGPDLNLCPKAAKRAITARTRALLVVHLAGNPAQMYEFRRLCKEYDLILIEDCAQAVGATLDGKYAGTFGDFGAFSLHPLKNLGTLGDGGIIVTNDITNTRWLKQARNHGHSSRDQCEFWSINSRIDALHAAFLTTILKDIPEYLETRREQAKRYIDGLSDVVCFPMIAEKAKSSYNFFMILSENRDALQKDLCDHGIDTKIHYPIPIHRLNAAKKNYTRSISNHDRLENAEKYSIQILSLPIGAHLSDAQIDYVIDKIINFMN